MSDEEQQFEIDASKKKIKIRGSDLLTSVIGMLMCSGLTALGMMLYNHQTNTKWQNEELTQAIKQLAIASAESVEVQREMNCLIALPQTEHGRDVAFCRRVTGRR